MTTKNRFLKKDLQLHSAYELLKSSYPAAGYTSTNLALKTTNSPFVSYWRRLGSTTAMSKAN